MNKWVLILLALGIGIVAIGCNREGSEAAKTTTGADPYVCVGSA